MALNAEISMERVGGVFPVTMFGLADDKYEEGDVVAIVGPNMLGFAPSGGAPAFGIVTKMETREDDVLVGVITSGFTETAKMTPTSANQPSYGDVAYCNPSGQLIKPPDDLPGGLYGMVTAINTDDNTATVRF